MSVQHIVDAAWDNNGDELIIGQLCQDSDKLGSVHFYFLIAGGEKRDLAASPY